MAANESCSLSIPRTSHPHLTSLGVLHPWGQLSPSLASVSHALGPVRAGDWLYWSQKTCSWELGGSHTQALRICTSHPCLAWPGPLLAPGLLQPFAALPEPVGRAGRLRPSPGTVPAGSARPPPSAAAAGGMGSPAACTWARGVSPRASSWAPSLPRGGAGPCCQDPSGSSCVHGIARNRVLLGGTNELSSANKGRAVPEAAPALAGPCWAPAP